MEPRVEPRETRKRVQRARPAYRTRLPKHGSPVSFQFSDATSVASNDSHHSTEEAQAMNVEEMINHLNLKTTAEMNLHYHRACNVNLKESLAAMRVELMNETAHTQCKFFELGKTAGEQQMKQSLEAWKQEVLDEASEKLQQAQSLTALIQANHSSQSEQPHSSGNMMSLAQVTMRSFLHPNPRATPSCTRISMAFI